MGMRKGIKTSIYLNETDQEIIQEWKEGMRWDSTVDVIRYALRKLGQPRLLPISHVNKVVKEGDTTIVYD